MGLFDKINRRESDIRLEHLEKALDKISGDTHRILESVKESNTDLLERISEKYATQLDLEHEKAKLKAQLSEAVQECKSEIYKQMARYGTIAIAVLGVLEWLIKTAVFK